MTRQLTRTVSLEKWQPPAPPPENRPRAVVDWAIDRFSDREVAMTTSFGMESIVLMHLLEPRVPDLRVIYVDTGFLFAETHALREKLTTLFPQFRFEAVEPQLTAQDQAREIRPELWKEDPDLCCKIRKVEPLHRAIQGVDIWFASLRRDQSPSRWNTQLVEWNWQYQLLKICPLVTWSRRKVYDYLVEHNLPYNELHDQDYPTVGCTHCTKPVPGTRPWEYSRDGRWAGQEKKECGLHGDGI